MNLSAYSISISGIGDSGCCLTPLTDIKVVRHPFCVDYDAVKYMWCVCFCCVEGDDLSTGV